MHIVADENIPYAREAFGTLGEIELQTGRAMTAQSVRRAALLFVRSVTAVDAELLRGSSVRFVGTATIGTDHIDLDYLQEREIGFASAPGSNANSVGEYVTAALLTLGQRLGFSVEGKTLGVVGVGNVGTRVVEKATALGMNVLLNDPPLARETGDPKYVPIDDIFRADVITCHVPLTREGVDATYHLVDDDFVRKMKPGAVLLNTSRGAVARGEALKQRRLGAVVLDVWEGEPDIDIDLLDMVAIGTPHIAGYSFDGKVAGAWMIYEAACEFLGLAPTWRPSDSLPPPEHAAVKVDAERRNGEDVLREIVSTLYDIEADDARLRAVRDLAAGERGACFDQLRKTYPIRREFFNTTVTLRGADDALRRKTEALGFNVA